MSRAQAKSREILIGCRGMTKSFSERPRFEIFPHYNAISLPVNKAGCPHCRVMTSGFGVGFSTRLATYADLDSDVDYQPMRAHCRRTVQAATSRL